MHFVCLLLVLCFVLCLFFFPRRGTIISPSPRSRRTYRFAICFHTGASGVPHHGCYFLALKPHFISLHTSQPLMPAALQSKIPPCAKQLMLPPSEQKRCSDTASHVAGSGNVPALSRTAQASPLHLSFGVPRAPRVQHCLGDGGGGGGIALSRSPAGDRHSPHAPSPCRDGHLPKHNSSQQPAPSPGGFTLAASSTGEGKAIRTFWTERLSQTGFSKEEGKESSCCLRGPGSYRVRERGKRNPSPPPPRRQRRGSPAGSARRHRPPRSRRRSRSRSLLRHGAGPAPAPAPAPLLSRPPAPGHRRPSET